MSLFDDLKKLDHVKNHPFIKKAEEDQRASEEKMEKLSQELQNSFAFEFNDVDYSSIPEFFGETGAYGYGKASKKCLSELTVDAYEVVRDALDCFELPVRPKISYNNSKNIKYANDAPDKVLSGNIFFNVDFRTLTGAVKSATIGVPVTKGLLLDPSTLEMDGTVRVLAQSTFNDIIGRGTIYDLDPITSGMFSVPLSAEDRINEVELREERGFQPVDNSSTYYLSRERKQSREKAIPKTYSKVVADLKKALESGTDTFPRKWEYICREYIMKYVSECEKDAWMPHLVNEGYVINPLGNNRGRKVSQQATIPDAGPASDGNYYYKGTVAPIERLDAVKFQGMEGPIHGTVQDIQGGISIVKSNKGYIYEVENYDLVPLPSTLKKMYSIGDVKGAQSIGWGAAGGPTDNVPFIETEPNSIEMGNNARYYKDTVMPIESEDRVKFNSGKGYIRGLVSDLGADEWVYVMDNDNITYRVHFEDVEALPSTFRKMWTKPQEEVSEIPELDPEDMKENV
jgi:hypothetical protein